MDKIDIRETKTNSVYSVNKTNDIPISVEQTGKEIPLLNIENEIDAYDTYLKERANCTKYRLIVAVKPLCSNVLFNACTEIVKDEGSDSARNITDNGTTLTEDGIYGKTIVTRNDMIDDTEYSKENIGYDYHVGLDIFGNHILRNKSFRIVNPFSKEEDKYTFNTISDIMRTDDGKDVMFFPRIANSTQSVKKHLYEIYDLYHFYDNGKGDSESISNNLVEDNGWFGFYNNAVLDTNNMGVGHVINNKGNCEFIDMYPDRTLYSFTPKFNEHRNRIEDNWKLFITYPKENYYDHQLVTNIDIIDNNGNVDTTKKADKKTNALLALSVKYQYGNNGDSQLQIRSYCKHGLSTGDDILIYYSFNNGQSFSTTENSYIVGGLGDGSGKYNENYFSINSSYIIDDIITQSIILDLFYIDLGSLQPSGSIYVSELESITQISLSTNIGIKSRDNNGIRYYILKEEFYDENGNVDSNLINNKINEWLSNSVQIRFAKSVRGTKCSYYIRKFYKIPNWKYSNEQITLDTSLNLESYKSFVKENAGDGEKMYEFDDSTNKLAFAKTIFGDDVTENLFMDSIDINNLTDNLNRPVTELYITILRNNKGYKKWYGTDNYTDDDIEYSHCFGPINSGINYSTIDGDNILSVRKKKGRLSCSSEINNNGLYNSFSLEENDNSRSESEIRDYDDWFFGDVVCYSGAEYKEEILDDVYFRFNTVQREIGGGYQVDYNNMDEKYVFSYKEIEKDDYSNDGTFSIGIYSEKNSGIYHLAEQKTRPEGYMYKAHYRIPISTYGTTIIQDGHNSIMFSKATPIQSNGIFIKITTLSKHGFVDGRHGYICDDTNNIMYDTNIVSVIDAYNFLISPISRDSENYVDWITTCEKLNNMEFYFRAHNSEIPYYANKISPNVYIWRNIEISGEKNNRINKYPFANNNIYIEYPLNFYLKRQDASGINGLNLLNNSNTTVIDGLKDKGGKTDETYIYDKQYKSNNDLQAC